MTAAAPAPAGGERRPGPPALSRIEDCPTCGQRITSVMDRVGKPVRFNCDDNGKAVRSPVGEWWAARFSDRWCVVRPERGEDPPSTGGGVRYRQHNCRRTVEELAAEDVLRQVFGVVEVLSLPDGPVQGEMGR